MELHQLRYVVEVAKAGSFTRAADALYLAQPSLSVQVRKLEAELGTRLFERLGRRVVLTSAGEEFLPHAQRALFEVEQARQRVEEVLGLRRGRVAVGVLPSVGARILPGVLAAFRADRPGVEVSIVEHDVPWEFERMVHAGELDLAVTRAPCGRRDLCTATLVKEPMVALLPPGHPLGGRATVSLTDLVDEDFVTMRPGYGLRDLMVDVCRRAGFDPRIAVETGQLTIVHGMVDAGVGVSVLPQLAAGDDVAAPRLVESYATRELVVVWRSGQSLAPPAAAFRDYLLGDGGQGAAPASAR